jgi:hypothetical protein
LIKGFHGHDRGLVHQHKRLERKAAMLLHQKIAEKATINCLSNGLLFVSPSTTGDVGR